MSISSTGGSSQSDLYAIMQQMQMQQALTNAMSQSSSSSGSQESAITAALAALDDADDADDSDDASSTCAMGQAQGTGSATNVSPFAASSAQTQQEQQMGLVSPQHFVA